jgi:hypothetical protein
MQDPHLNSKVTIEDLLRLKRAERPTPEFWSNFERELHQKQLTALVEKRRWWHGLSGLLTRRVYLPAGAAAAVAFTLVAVRYQAPVQMAQAESEDASRIAAATQAVEMLPATVVESFESRREQPAVVAHRVAALAEAAAPVPAAVMNVSQEEVSPSARSIAANLARLEQSEPDLLHAVMGNRLSSPARVQSAVVRHESEAAPANDSSSRYRLIARYADRALSPVPSAPAPVRERIARRLGDDLVDDVSRFGVGANRVSLKF